MNGPRVAAFALIAGAFVACARPHRTEAPLSAPHSTAAQAGSAACRSEEDAWLTMRRAGADYPAAIATLQSVGDCWVAAGDVKRAQIFYEAVKKEFADRVCDGEGVACPVLAAEELRRLDCGGGWTAQSAEAAWRDFFAALERDDGDPKARRVRPDVRVEGTRIDPNAEGCFAEAYAVPRSVRADRARLRSQVTASQRPWAERSVAAPIGPDDRPWKNYAPGVYRFFRLRACQAPRPVPGETGRGFYIQIAPVEGERTDPPCATS